MLELINVTKKYEANSGDTVAMNSISIKFPDKGLIFITGKSGSGKTTLLNVIGGLDSFDEGEIIINGKKFSSFTQDEYDSYRNTFVGFIFQDYNLLSEYTIEKNIRIANELQGKTTSTKKILEYLEEFNISGLQNRKPNEISGGQKQRAAIVRSLLKDPQIIMADEPTGALDSVTGVQVMGTLKELSKEKLIIVISHDLELAEKYADRIIRLVDGNIVEDVTLTEKEIKGNVYEDDNSVVVRTGATLTESENQTLLKAIKEKKKLNSADNISVRKRHKTKEVVSTSDEQDVKLIKSKMKFKSIAGFGVKSLTAKPGRLILTIILSVIAFSVFCLFDTVASYSNARLVRKLLQSSDYKAISLSTDYYSDNYNGETLRLSSSDIEKYSNEYGYDFRPVYDLNDRDFSSANGEGSIENLVDSSGLTLGPMYYYDYFTGFVEFKDSEIERNKDGIATVIDRAGFNLNLVDGNFPKLEYDENGLVKSTSLKYVAISDYMAKSISYWKGDVNREHSLIDTKFKVLGVEYIIKGIYDCGAIPNKYEELKTKEFVDKNDSLANELKTYLNSGLFLNMLVPEGYVDASLKNKARIANTYSGKTRYRFILEDKDYHPYASPISENSKFYNVNDLSYENVIFIDEEREKTLEEGKVFNLKEDEILLHFDSIRFSELIYLEQIRQFRATPENQTIIDNLSKILFPYSYYRVEAPFTPEKRVAFREYVNILKGIFDKNNDPNYIREATLNVVKEGVTASSKRYKIAGFYMGVNKDYVVTDRNMYPIAMSSQGLEDIGIYPNQGIYGRMIAPLKENKKGAKLLSKAMSTTSGVKLSWYNNTALESMEYNAETISLLSQLFLYVALALMAFSVFMLFNYISTSISSKKKSIGVLRALGSSGKNIFMMFLIESLIIAIINAILSCLVASACCVVLNYYIKNVMNLVIDFAVFGLRQILIVAGVSIFTAIASSLFPIIKIAKEKPVRLIKDL